MPDVLVVDDDRGVRRVLHRALAHVGFEVREAIDGLAALDEVTAYPPSGVVLDIGGFFPGIEVVRSIRAQGRTLPVCVLSQRHGGTPIDLLEAGADDFATKPVAADDVASRVAAMVAMHESGDDRPVSRGELALDPVRPCATRRGRDLELTVREFDLLRILTRNGGHVLSRAEILAQVWGYTWDVDDRVVDVFVGALCRKLEAAGEPRILTNVQNAGFVLNP